MKLWLKYSLILTVCYIVFSLIMYVTGLEKSDAATYINWLWVVILIAVLYMGLKERREQLGGFMEFGQGFGFGMSANTVSILLYAVYSYIYFSMINPGFIDFAREKAITQMEEKGQSAEEIEMAIKYMDMMMNPVAFTLWMLLFGLIIGLIVCLVMAAIMKKPNPAPVG